MKNENMLNTTVHAVYTGAYEETQQWMVVDWMQYHIDYSGIRRNTILCLLKHEGKWTMSSQQITQAEWTQQRPHDLS